MPSLAPRSAGRLVVLALLAAGPLGAQVTGLAGWDIFLDPGHAGTNQNVGIFGYSEPEKVLRVGLHLRDLLLTTTDIDTVYMSRMNDQDMANMDRNQSLTQRIDLANSLQASWYHSLHSNAGAPSSNSTLLLWGEYYDGREKVPEGGKRMSDIMFDPLLPLPRIIGEQLFEEDLCFVRNVLPLWPV